MKLKILILFLLTSLAFTTYSQDSLFKKLINKSTFEKNGDSLRAINFYRTVNGLNKSIRQNFNNSKVSVAINSEIYDVKIVNDTIYLFNGLDLQTGKKLNDTYYIFSSEVIKKCTKIPTASISYLMSAWSYEAKDKHSWAHYDLDELSKIPIKENEIYKYYDLNKIVIIFQH